MKNIKISNYNCLFLLAHPLVFISCVEAIFRHMYIWNWRVFLITGRLIQCQVHAWPQRKSDSGLTKVTLQSPYSAWVPCQSLLGSSFVNFHVDVAEQSMDSQTGA